ncbi:actin depolymerizing protein [Fistulina hepatica ATCC 64428]|nr:actin depolymerizing protein [Fistulina hepatica ATCC 64428]
MSATSGIGVSQELAARFSSAVDSKTTRFIKISIENESLVPSLIIPGEGTFQKDLSKLQDPEVLADNVPAYVLAKLDDPPSDWLAISYVPDTAAVRDKMLYASSRASLLKHLGSTAFSDTIFATSKNDLTAEAYHAHRKHMAAPQPLSEREQEIADARAAERESGLHSAYSASRPNGGLFAARTGFVWSDDLEEAIQQLAKSDDCRLLIVTVDPKTETLVLQSSTELSMASLPSSIPVSDPCYAIVAWPHTLTSPPRREIVFIYSCPSSSPVKPRMMYSAGALITFKGVEALVQGVQSDAIPKKIETSDPTEVDEDFLVFKLALPSGGPTGTDSHIFTPAEEKKTFAKPRGPQRRPR